MSPPAPGCAGCFEGRAYKKLHAQITDPLFLLLSRLVLKLRTLAGQNIFYSEDGRVIDLKRGGVLGGCTVISGQLANQRLSYIVVCDYTVHVNFSLCRIID